MLVSLIKGHQIFNLTLPNIVYGNYWVTGFDEQSIEQNLINIEAYNGKWKLNSNQDVVILEKNVQLESVILQNYGFYLLEILETKERVLLHCAPVFDETYRYYYLVNGNDVTIGNDEKAVINYKHPLCSKHHASITFKNNIFTVFDVESKIGVYVNDDKINKSRVLESGDIVFIAGLKIIVMIEDNKPIMIINNPCNLVSFKPVIFQERIASDINFNKNYTKEEERDIKVYTDDDYFHKRPRFKSNIEKLDLKIDPPPAKQEQEDQPLILTIGPMITMGMSSVVTGMTTLNNVATGQITWDAALPSLIICGAMLATMVLWPFLTKLYQKNKQFRRERLRIKKYTKYIDEKRQLISDTIKLQSKILNENYLPLMECSNIIMEQKMNLWERKITEEDFLTVSLGYGTKKMSIDINYPEEHFSLDKDKMKDILSTLVNEPKELNNVPIAYSFYQKNITAVIGDYELSKRFMDNILLQLITFHSYDELKIVVLTNKDYENDWDYLKVCPHCFNDFRTVRFFSSTNDEIKEICYLLEREFSERLDLANENIGEGHIYSPHYLIITDCYKAIRNFDFIKKVLKNDVNLGFSLVIMNNRVSNLPNGCNSFINISASKCEVFENVLNSNIQAFKVDTDSQYNLYECCHTLANIPIEFSNDLEGKIPSKVGFLELYDVGKTEQLNSLSRWQKNNPILTLQAPIGIGKSGEKLSLDLHEKFHGPHGLIAGMTGSGKSEFIITYILSMAINYHPYEVQFILIDYKGGGLTGAFINEETGEKLPHIVGTITNLDSNEINRSLSSIESELKRRQKIFNEARQISGESTIDIYKYQGLFRRGIVKEPVAHLFIISDEFAELKSQQPDFMQQLISTARIGRSLGVHLILATQKPSGVVDNQIWSNTRFRVCLRVQEKADSTDVIKCPDAAFLKQTGRFYLQVGYNEIFVLGQAAWAGNQYIPSEKMKKEIDTSLDFINNVGYVIKNVETEKNEKKVIANGEELTSIVKYLMKIAEDKNIHNKPLWLEKIPAYINVDALKKKYDYKSSDYIIEPIIGEYDVPSKQEQNLLTARFCDGNILVYGIAGSGKENIITTTIYSSADLYTPEDVNYYILEFGSEALRMFNNMPIVGDIVFAGEDDKITNLYKMLFDVIEERKDLFMNYSGDFIEYLKNSGKKLPAIVVVINNFEAYDESYQNLEDKLLQLTREGIRYGIYFMITLSNPNGMRYKLKANFVQNYVLQQNNDTDYTNILGNVHKTYPSKIFGRGIIKLDNIYEFQTALVNKRENIAEFIKDKVNYYRKTYKTKARPIPILPDKVTYFDISRGLDSNNLVVGISKNDLSIVKYPIYKNFVNLIVAQDLAITETFINNMIKQLENKNNNNLIIINTDELNIKVNDLKRNRYYDNDFDNVFSLLEKYIRENNDVFEKNGKNKNIFKKSNKITCIIIGVDNLKAKLNTDNQGKFEDLFTKSQNLGLVNYVIIDSTDKIKKIEYDNWYKSYVNNNQGIWIGNGIADQFSLKISNVTKELRQEIGDNFCYVVKRGKPELVKYVEEFETDDIIEEL